MLEGVPSFIFVQAKYTIEVRWAVSRYLCAARCKKKACPTLRAPGGTRHLAACGAPGRAPAARTPAHVESACSALVGIVDGMAPTCIVALQTSEAEHVGVDQVAACFALFHELCLMQNLPLLCCRRQKRSALAWIKWPRSCPPAPHPAATSVRRQPAVWPLSPQPDAVQRHAGRQRLRAS